MKVSNEPIRHGYAIDIATGAAYAKQQSVQTIYINATQDELAALLKRITAGKPACTVRVFNTVSIPAFTKLAEVVIENATSKA